MHADPHDWLALGPYLVGNLSCGSGSVAWTTSTHPITPESGGRTDVIKMANQAGGQASIVASAKHGGDLGTPVWIAGSWLVYLEYQQHGQTSRTDFWYLNAVEWTSGQYRELAAATAGPPLNELPWYEAADGRAVWNQLDLSGKAILRTYEFTSGETTTLPIPAGMYPVQPTISGDQVAFVDNSADPHHASETWLGRTGSLERLDLKTGQVRTLSADPTAFQPRTAGGVVVWTVFPGGNPVAAAAVPMAGGTVKAFGVDPAVPQTNGSIVVWYDFATLHFMAFKLKQDRLVELQIGTWADVRSEFALCGNRLWFALPPGIHGSSIIRYVDLTAL